jgi:hypothetical protein
MKVSRAIVGGLLLLACAGPAASRQPEQAKIVFTVGPRGPAMHYPPGHQPTAQLPQWSGGFTDLTGQSIHYVMAGADPATSNTTTTIRVVIVPVVTVYGAENGNMTFDPRKDKVNGDQTAIQNLIASPLFDDGADFVSGSVDLGQTQYIDAYQRGNFWGQVSTNTGYHTVFKLIKIKGIEPLTMSVRPNQGQVRAYPRSTGIFGSNVIGTIDFFALNSNITTYLRKNNTKITPDILPLFVSDDILYPVNGVLGAGYHAVLSQQPTGQTFAYSTYLYDFVSGGNVIGFSHELAEWMDDPFIDNHVNCTDNGILEVADPIDKLPGEGAFRVRLNGFDYQLEPPAYLPYFGAPAGTSANGWISFHNNLTNVCPGQ